MSLISKSPFRLIRFIFFAVTLGAFSGLKAQTSMSNYVLFGGKAAAGQTTPAAPGYGVFFGSSCNLQATIQGGGLGSVGSYNQVRSSGALTINGNVYSGGTIQLANSNVIKGNLAAGLSPAGVPGTIVSVGTGAMIGVSGDLTKGNINANGKVTIGGGNVYGKVTLPAPSSTYPYSGPVPAGGVVYGTPVLPTLPQMPAIRVFPNFGTTNITNTMTIGPGAYGDINLGNKTLTLSGPGTYIFKSIITTGPNCSIVYNFNNTTSGDFLIYVHKDIILNKTSFSTINGGSPNRIYVETHGTGSTNTGDNTFAFSMSNGSNGSGNPAGWLGSLWAPYAAVKVGAPNGPSSSVVGALWSGTQVSIDGGVSVTFAPYNLCSPPNANAGPDKPLDFVNLTTLNGSSTTAGVTYSWQAINGGVITTPTNAASITVSAAGTYILTVTASAGCLTRDTAIVTGKVTDIIGSELQAVVQNNGAQSPFFDIRNGKIFIDVIVKAGEYTYVKNKLTAGAGPWFMTDLLGEDASQLIITGLFPINKLSDLNTDPDLSPRIVYARPYYRAFNNTISDPTGLVTTQGDSSVKANLVRLGYNLSGEGIKIGVLSNSFNTITSASSNPVNSTAADDVREKDLPGPGNPNNALPVTVLKESRFVRSDEGRAMLQIIHDIAPKAQLYFRTGIETANDFANGIRELKAAGCNIITDDITYITEPFLKDGVVAAAVSEVTAAGTTYITSAGNFANKSFESVFNPIAAPAGLSGTAHDFGSNNPFMNITLVPGQQYTIVLQWLDNIYSLGETASNGTKNDLDIYLTPNTDGSALFGFNRNNLNGDPIEFLPFIYSGPASTRLLVLNNTTNNAGNPPPRFKIVVFQGDITFSNLSAGSTIVGQSNADSAITVGAARFDRKATLEAFSSIGGTVVNNVARNKPDLVAPDGVNTTVNMGIDQPNDPDTQYSNFFGTSAAAPHVAGVAALLMEGKKKFLNQPTVSPYEIKTLLKSTATPMGSSNGYNYASGAGFINADAAMRSFAAPDPSLIQLVVPPNTTPGTNPFTLTITGLNLSPNSVVRFRDSSLALTYLSTGRDTARAAVPTFIGDPAISVYTPPLFTNGIDGGTSDTLKFFGVQKKEVVVKADNQVKKYAQAFPAFTYTVTVDGVPLNNLPAPGLTLQQLGLDVMTLTSSANNNIYSNVGTYSITPNRPFSNTDPVDIGLKELYNYTFTNGTLTVAKLPVTVTARDTTVTYLQKIPDIQFNYALTNAGDAASIPDIGTVLNTVQTTHQSQLAKDGTGKDVLGLVNGQAVTIVNGQAIPIVNGQAVTIVNGQAVTIVNGQAIPIVNGQAVTIVNGLVTDTIPDALTAPEINKLSFQAGPQSLQSTRSIQNKELINGTYVTSSTNVVDITQESILDFNTNAAQTTMLNSLSGVNARGLVAQPSYENGQAVTIVNGQAVTIVNGQAVTIVNGQAVTIVNGQAVTIVNGQAIPIVNSLERTAVVLDEAEIGQGVNQLKSLNMISGLDAGSQFIIPGSFVNNNYDITHIAGVVTILPAPVKITPVPGQQKVYGTDDPVFTYTNNAGLTAGDFQGAISRTAGNTAGNYEYSIGTLSAGPNYSLSINGNNTFAITSRPIVITPSAGQSKVYGEADPIFTYTASEALQPGDSYTGALEREAGSNKGNYSYTLGSLSAGTNYTLTLGGTNTFAITSRPVVITPVAGQSKVYGESDPVFTYTASEALQAGDSYTGALAREPGSNKGNYAYTLGSLSAGTNYTLTLGGTNTFAITSRPVVITPVAGQSKVYGEADPVFTYTASETLQAGDSYTGALAREPGSNKGSYGYTLGNLSAGLNYTLTLGGTNTFAITSRPVVITPVAGQSKIYGSDDPVFTYTASESLQQGDSYTGALSREQGKNKGNYAYTLGSLSAGPNYTLSLGGSSTFAITSRPVVITPVTGQSKIFGDVDPVFTYTASEALQPGDSYTGALNREPGSNTGTYAFTLGSLSAGNNYSLSLGGTVRFTINPKPVTITPNTGQFKIYGAADPVFTYTNNAGLSSGSFTGVLGRASGSNAGTYAYTLNTLSAGTNYILGLAAGITFEIRKAPLEVKADLKWIYKGAALPVFTSTITGLKNGDNPAVTYTLSPSCTGAAGLYAIIPLLSPFANSVNYTVTYINGQLYINPKGTGADDVDTYLQCVEDRGASYVPQNRRYVARFYSKNTNSTPVYIPVGVNNKLTSTGSFDGSQQPVVFLPGTGTTSFTVPFDGISLKWELKSYEGNTLITEYVIASASSARCTTTGRSTMDIPDENDAAEKPVRVIEVSKQPVQAGQEETSGNAILYPNPASDRVIITLQNGLLNDKSLFIYDVSGRACPVKIIRRIAGNSIELDVSGLANGLYLLRYKETGVVKAIRFIKE